MIKNMRATFSIFLIFLISIGCNTDAPQREVNPQYAAHYQKGMDALDMNNFTEAEKAFQMCLQIDTNAHDARMQLARTYVRQQKWGLAEETLQELIGRLKDIGVRNPSYKDQLSKAYLTLAQVFSYQQRFSDSTTALTNALEVNPDDTEARIRLGYFLGAPQQMLVPDLSASKRQFEQVLELEPNNLEAMLQLGLAEFRLGEADKAAERFENIIRNYRRHSGAYYYLGVYHLRHGAPEKAVENFKESLRLKPRDPETLWNLWTAYSELGGYPADLPEEFKIKPWEGFITPNSVKEDSPFIDVASDLKMDKVDGGRGSAWGDYDNDGDLDIVAVGTYQPHALFRNNGDGTFTNTADQAGIADSRGGWGSLFADYNNDGYPDLYITRGGWSGPAENTLYHNNGDGTFTDITHTAGVADPQSSFCAAWADYDNDGYLDLYIADGVIGDGAANVLYRNNGDGTFTNTAAVAGVADTGNSLGTAWGDYDKDGHIDLHIVNFGQSNVLYRNNGDGTFTDVTPTTGMNLPVTDPFVTFFLDVDNDADLDIFISNSGSFQAFIAGQITGTAPHDGDRQVLYRNNGDGTFTDVTRESGLYHAFGAMGANFEDINSDGYLDIYLATGAPQMGRLERDALFRNNGDGTFTDATAALGLGNIGKGHGVTFGDVDTDGDVDIYVPVGGAFIGDQWHNLFYRNRGTGNNYLTLKLVGVKSNRDGIGAKVTLHIGDDVIYREVSGGCGFGSTNSLALEIGLGEHTKVDTLEIVWPSGQVDTHRNLSVNQKLEVIEGASL
ncbi:tetratricopeptide repeat protein [Candidatus Poribacteria bacterium]|nr:tetratricopeptide repeat protein [Candidatus Poribacteria bacterium]